MVTPLRSRREDRKVTGPNLVATALAMVSILVVFAAGVIGVWLTDEPRIFPLVLLPTVVAASLMFSFYEWRRTSRETDRSSRYDGRGNTA
jgi:hypothetical protein